MDLRAMFDLVRRRLFTPAHARNWMHESALVLRRQRLAATGGDPLRDRGLPHFDAHGGNGLHTAYPSARSNLAADTDGVDVAGVQFPFPAVGPHLR